MSLEAPGPAEQELGVRYRRAEDQQEDRVKELEAAFRPQPQPRHRKLSAAGIEAYAGGARFGSAAYSLRDTGRAHAPP